MTTMSGAGDARALFDPFAADLIENPYPHYDRLRAAEPVYWEPILGLWVVTRQDDVRNVLEDDTFDVVELGAIIAEVGQRSGKDLRFLVRTIDAVTFFRNGEKHRVGRRSLTRVLTRVPYRQLEPLIDDIAASLAAELSKRQEFDAAGDFAIPLPNQVMAHIVGLPQSDAQFLYAIGHDMIMAFEVVSTGVYEALDRKGERALRHIAQRIDSALSSGSEGALQCFYEDAPSEGEEKMMEAAAQVFFAFFVGTLTTSALIAFCIDSLIEQPELYRRAREDVSLSGAIADEAARLQSPVQRSLRVSERDCVIGGKKIRRGERMLLLLGAANRDPARFPDANRLDPERKSKGDVAFGGGKHSCVGATLARLEAKIALEHFLRLPPVAPSGRPKKWHPGFTVRRLTSLPVRFAHD